MSNKDKNVRVVIADDDPAVALLLGAWVEELGHTAIHCSDGKEALDVWKQHWEKLGNENEEEERTNNFNEEFKNETEEFMKTFNFK